MNFLPFALPDIGDEEINEVIDTMRSGWITTGPKARKFEKDFGAFLGDESLHCLAVNSATSGLHLALEAIGIGIGDEVITTPNTFTATAEVIRYLGADPVFVDIDPNTLNIDPSKIEAAITKKTKAIIPVHFAGLSCDMDKIISTARKYNLFVIEDAAHSFPAKYKGNLIGCLDTDVTVFSFYATKTITTGEGGMVVTRNSDIYERCKVMRLHGINRDSFDRYNTDKPSWYYEVVAPGFKYNMTDVAAAMGIQQLKKAWRFQKRRELIADTYDESFARLPVLLPPRARAGAVHAWHLYPLRLNAELSIDREEFINRVTAKGVGCSVHFIPLHIQPYWRDAYNLKSSDFPCAYDSYCKEVSLPIYTKMSDDDVLRVIKAVTEVIAEC